jgi:hypothetical protein
MKEQIIKKEQLCEYPLSQFPYYTSKYKLPSFGNGEIRHLPYHKEFASRILSVVMLRERKSIMPWILVYPKSRQKSYQAIRPTPELLDELERLFERSEGNKKITADLQKAQKAQKVYDRILLNLEERDRKRGRPRS